MSGGRRGPLRRLLVATALVATELAAACRDRRAAPAEECGADTTWAHPEPRALVDEYLERGGDGSFLQSDPWHDGAVACPAHAPGADEATIVAGWTVAPLAQSADTARFALRFARLGRLTQDSAGAVAVAGAGEEVDTVVVVRTPAGWRIGDPEPAPHLLPEAVRRRLPDVRGAAWLDSLAADADSS